jgi:hypothetical protein
MMTERAKLVTDTLQKAGLGLLVGAFFQDQHPAFTLLFIMLGLISLICAYGLTPDDQA